MHVRAGRAGLGLMLSVAVIAAGFAACGEDDSSSGTAGNGVDRAFATAMIPHHRSAVEMAEVARQRSRRPEVKELANDIVSTQNAEIERLRAVDRRLEQAGVAPGDLGVPEHEMGMSEDAETLHDAKPFDREFIDMMIPHHQGAIRMARLELRNGESAELKKLARAIVDAQTKEIDQMNTWRVDWFGGLSPAGGVPADEAGEHGGHGR